MGKYTAEQRAAMGLPGEMPKHVAIIMDGNGRWAQQRGLPRALGHRAGMERLNGIIRLTSDLSIEALSLFAFSTENWKRPQDEISILFGLLLEYFSREIDELHQNDVRIRILGERSPFPAEVREVIENAMQKTAKNNGLRLNIALNYGGRDEFVRVARAIAADVQNGVIHASDVNAELVESKLDTTGLPPVDFMIRTSGEQRTSNFLLYQAAYAELLFAAEYWPAFSNDRYMDALREYQKRSRRYGGL